MFFKDEIPPPRYSVNDGELLNETKLELDLGAVDLTRSNLLLLAPRVQSLIKDLGGTEITRFQLTSTTVPRERLVNSSAVDFYEVDADIEDFATSRTHTITVHNGPNGFKLVLLPALSETEDAFLGSELVKRLDPLQVVLVAPGSSFMESQLFYLATSNFQLGTLGVPPAEPPAVVQGSGAAAVSRAQKLGIPALALVLNSEGAVHHEAFSRAAFEQLRNALLLFLGIKRVHPSQVERGMSILYV